MGHGEPKQLSFSKPINKDHTSGIVGFQQLLVDLIRERRNGAEWMNAELC